MILFEDNSSEYILDLLEKIRVEVERESEVTISLGVTLSSNENLQSYEFMLHEADEALYIAKNAGRNQIALYNRDKR